jgi:hypothetical protein
MSRPDPIEYAERLYGAIRAANFSPMSFLAFGNAVKEGVAMRSMPRIAAEPFMRIVGEMLELEEEAAEEDEIDVVVLDAPTPVEPAAEQAVATASDQQRTTPTAVAPVTEPAAPSGTPSERKRNGGKR